MLKIKVNDKEIEVEKVLQFYKHVSKLDMKFPDFVIMKNYL